MKYIFYFLLQQDLDEIERKFHDLKVAYRQAKDRVAQLEKAVGKENLSSNVPRSALETENQSLIRRIKELEELNSRIQTDDMKNEAMIKLKEDVDNVQKKYEMAKRLCNIRNDDIAKLKQEIENFKIKINELQTEADSKLAKLQKKYNTAKEIAEMRRHKIAELGGEPL